MFAVSSHAIEQLTNMVSNIALINGETSAIPVDFKPLVFIAEDPKKSSVDCEGT